jgi:hypothetical protein
MVRRGSSAGRGAVAAALALLGLAGCGPRVYPVTGKVVVTDGDVKPLAGNHVELELEGNPSVRANGPIQDDGSFALGMFYGGRVLNGVIPGKYRARILLIQEDDDGAKKEARRPPVHWRFLEFQTSNLPVTVPADAEVVLKVTRTGPAKPVKRQTGCGEAEEGAATDEGESEDKD